MNPRKKTAQYATGKNTNVKVVMGYNEKKSAITNVPHVLDSMRMTWSMVNCVENGSGVQTAIVGNGCILNACLLLMFSYIYVCQVCNNTFA